MPVHGFIDEGAVCSWLFVCLPLFPIVCVFVFAGVCFAFARLCKAPAVAPCGLSTLWQYCKAWCWQFCPANPSSPHPDRTLATFITHSMRHLPMSPLPHALKESFIVIKSTKNSKLIFIYLFFIISFLVSFINIDVLVKWIQTKFIVFELARDFPQTYFSNRQ